MTETKSDELSISALAQKESELIESTILNQPNTQIAKARLLHEIDECLKDFSFFESHARRELDRAEKIQTELRERVIADAQNRNFRHIPAYWQIVRDIISGVEEGLCIYFKTLATYFPDELERYNPETLRYFLPYFSGHRQMLQPTTSLSYELGKVESKLEQFEYWRENIAPQIQDIDKAATYWGRPANFLVRSEWIGFSELGFVPGQIYDQYIEPWIKDRKVIFKVSREQIRARGLPGLVEDLERQIKANIEFGIADNERLIQSELAKCDEYNVDLKESDIKLGVGGRYYFRTLFHEFYREYLVNRLEEFKKPPSEIPSPAKKKDRDTAFARRAITILEQMIDDECTINSGRKGKMTEKAICQGVLAKWMSDAGKFRFGTTEKSISRYLKDIGEEVTAKEFIGQRVRQYIKDKIL